MTTPPVGNLPASPSIPLTPEVRAAYQDLYNKIQAELDSTMDAAAIEALNAWQPEVDQVLRKDELYTLAKDTTAFDALRKQINYTNQGLVNFAQPDFVDCLPFRHGRRYHCGDR